MSSVMDQLLDQRPLIAVMISLAAAITMPLFSRHPNWREGCTLLAATLKLFVVASMLSAVLAGETPSSASILLPQGLSLHLRADPLGLVFALTAATLWVMTSLYSIGYMRAKEAPRQTGYYVAFALCLSATTGLAFAGNLLTFFVFYEVLTLSTYPLVVHTRTAEARSAGRRYLVYTIGGGQLLLAAIVWTQVVAPGAEFVPGGFLAGRTSDVAMAVGFAAFMLGLGVKTALMPLHGWLPAAMAAPTPVSALLHAVAVVKAGAFGVVRVTGFVFGVDVLRAINADVVLAVAASVTIVVASIRALGERNLKRRLAYSTIGQLSYIVLGSALGTVAALTGAIFHIAAHAFMKITLFFCAGAIHVQVQRDNVDELDGLGKQMPVTLGAFMIGACGLAGIPLLAGFVGKWQIGVGAVEAGYPVFVVVLVVSGLFNIAYFFPIISDAFLKSSPVVGTDARPVITAPFVFSAGIAIMLGLFPDAGFHFYSLARLAASTIVMGPNGGGLP